MAMTKFCYICDRPIPKREVNRSVEKGWDTDKVICQKCRAKLDGSNASILREIDGATRQKPHDDE